MKHFYRILALFMALCMIFPLSACLGEEAEVTTEPPLTSAEETTAEETLPPEEETTTLYDKLAAMEPLALLRNGAKKTRNYKSYIKTTELVLNIPDHGEESREMVYIKNRDDFSQLEMIDGERQSYLMYVGGEFVIFTSVLGEMGYGVTLENESQYDKVMGDGPIVKNPTLFDFSGNENFGDGIVSAGDEGFIVNIDLTEKGKKLLLDEISGEPNTEYSVGRASITSWIDREGSIISVSLDADLIVKRLGTESTIRLTTHSSLETPNEEITIAPPEDLKIFRFATFDKFYDFYGRVSENYVRVLNYGHNFDYVNTLYIDKFKNERYELIYKSETRGRFNVDDGINLFRTVEVGPDKGSDKYYYYVDQAKTYQIEPSGETVERGDISGFELYESVLSGFFENLIGDYDVEGGCNLYTGDGKYSYSLVIESETALRLTREYLTLCGYDTSKCEISIIDAYNTCIAQKKTARMSGFRIRIRADIKYEGESFQIHINDLTQQYTGKVYFEEMPTKT